MFQAPSGPSVALPAGWEERQDANGRTYYVNHIGEPFFEGERNTWRRGRDLIWSTFSANNTVATPWSWRRHWRWRGRGEDEVLKSLFFSILILKIQWIIWEWMTILILILATQWTTWNWNWSQSWFFNLQWTTWQWRVERGGKERQKTVQQVLNITFNGFVNNRLLM